MAKAEYKDCEEIANWLLSHDIQLSVMESTGIYWLRHEVAEGGCLH